MKLKIVGALIAICIAGMFMGCDDPVSETPGINYKESGYVGTWVYEDGGTKYTYILTDEGKGTWTGVAADHEPGDLSIVWVPLSNGNVQLIETLIENSTIQPLKLGTLSHDKTKLIFGSTIYIKQP